MNTRLWLFSVAVLAACESPAQDIDIAAQPLTTSCNAFQPGHCGTCEDTLPFQQALQVSVPWCAIGLCPPGREPWFCNPTFLGPPIMCTTVTGSQPHDMNVYCCDPVAANQECATDADCGVMSAECYESKCIKKTCIVEQKPNGAPCSGGICKVWEPGRPAACGPDPD